MSLFKRAEKKQAKAKIALTGPSGSGKTMSALLLAKGIGGRCAFIDTENHSASLYANKFDGWSFDILAIDPPYTARKYHDAISAAIKENYDVLIIDSMTHMWAGEGGLLQQKEALDSRGGNSYTNWAQITKLHEAIKSDILHSPIHIIATMRSKQEYIMEQTDKGKMAPKKVGLAPIQRDGLEYEFTIVFDIGMDHQFMVSKDRTDLFDGVVSKITARTGEVIREWLDGGTPVVAAEMVSQDELSQALEQPGGKDRRPGGALNHAPASTKDLEAIQDLLEMRGISPNELSYLIASGYEFDGEKLPIWIAQELITFLSDESVTSATVMAKAEIMKSERGAKALVDKSSIKPKADPGEFVIPMGSLTGTKLKDATPKDVDKIIDWCQEQIKGGAKGVPPAILKLSKNAVEFKKSMGGG